MLGPWAKLTSANDLASTVASYWNKRGSYDPGPWNARTAGIALKRNQRLADVGPVLQFFDGDVVNRLTASAALKERARNVDHVPRASALVDQGRAAAPTKAAHRTP